MKNEAQPIPSGGHDQPTPAAQPVPSCPDCHERVSSLLHDLKCVKKIGQPVSAEATKPAGGEIPVHWDKGGNVDLVVQFGNAVPPVAPPEAEGAREPHDGWMNNWLYINIPRDQNCAYMWNKECRRMAGDWADFRVSFALAQKEAEISRLTAELKSSNQIREAEKKILIDEVAANTELRTALEHMVADAEAWAGVTHYFISGNEAHIKWQSLDEARAALAKGE